MAEEDSYTEAWFTVNCLDLDTNTIKVIYACNDLIDAERLYHSSYKNYSEDSNYLVIVKKTHTKVYSKREGYIYNTWPKKYIFSIDKCSETIFKTE